jgi:hypothetical protein
MSNLYEFSSLHTSRKSFQLIRCPVLFSCFERAERTTLLLFMLSSVFDCFDESGFSLRIRDNLPKLSSAVVCCSKVVDDAPCSFMRRIA